MKRQSKKNKDKCESAAEESAKSGQNKAGALTSDAGILYGGGLVVGGIVSAFGVSGLILSGLIVFVAVSNTASGRQDTDAQGTSEAKMFKSSVYHLGTKSE